jgi:TonB family protein
MIRIGESKLAQARERRWSRPYNALDPAVVQLREEQAPSRRRAIRLGVLLAVVFHLVVFMIVFPSYYEERVLKIGSTPKVYRLRAVTFQPPPRPRVRRSVVKPKARIVPVPDATPDDPEPIRFDDQAVDVSELDFPDIGESTVVPEGPLGPSIGPMQIGGNVLAPVRVYAPDPRYPEEARHARVQGVVILQTIIDTVGNVTDVRVLKGLPSGLTEAAVDAVSSWRFKPATLEGEPVAVYYLVTVSFSVQ